MSSTNRFLPIVLFAFSFFATFVLLGVLVNNQIAPQAQVLGGIALSIVSFLCFLCGHWLIGKDLSGNWLINAIKTRGFLGDSLVYPEGDLAKSVINLWIIIGTAALYISFRAHRNLEDFVLLEAVAFPLILWRISANQSERTENDSRSDKLAVTAGKLKVIESGLKKSKAELKTVGTKLAKAKNELEEGENKLKVTETRLRNCDAELRTTDIKLEESHTKLEEIETELKTYQAKLEATGITKRLEDKPEVSEAELNGAKGQVKGVKLDKEKQEA